jgi:hypothetical protein
VSIRVVLRALAPLVLHALAREVDAACGLLLHSSLDLPGFVGSALRLVDLGRLAERAALWTLGGMVAWLAFGAWRSRRDGRALGEALAQEAGAFTPLYLRPALTLLSLASLVARPIFPYGFTLPVALTQDWGSAQDAATAAAFVALRFPAIASGRRATFRRVTPGTPGVFFVSFLVYALLSPPWARQWEGHPGNEPKYLRMAVALGHELSLDVEGVDAPMEELEPSPLPTALRRALDGLIRESGHMAAAVLRGPDAVGKGAITATRITRQTIRGKEGGVFHVLAPGPSIVLAPALRVDRALNRALGTKGRLAVSLLLWNALAAALVAALFVLVRDAGGSTGLGAAVAFGFGLVPPFLFYFFQFYPEMPGALVLAVALRLLLLRPAWSANRPRGKAPLSAWGLGLLLASLPWLHQKFFPLWGVLVATALAIAVHRLVTLPTLLALLIPQAATLYLTALYNFAIAGSVRPDALFLAWGPGGVTSARVGQGLFGLLLDARYGLLPYAPVYLLAGGGLLAGGAGAARLRWGLPAAVVYYLTVASADNWSGAVCNLGRYVMPIAPLLVALVGAALARAGGRRGPLAVTLTLAAWTGLLAVALWRDPHAANDSALLLAKSAFADGNVYVPNLFIRTWSEGAPGLFFRIAAWAALAVVLAGWLRRAAQGRGGTSPHRALVGVVTLGLGVGFLLERWPSGRTSPRFADALRLPREAALFLSGATRWDESALRAPAGSVDVLLRSAEPLDAAAVLIGGDGFVSAPGLAPMALRPSGVIVNLPLTHLMTLTGRRGVRETLQRTTLAVDAPTGVVVRAAPAVPADRPE